MNDTTKTPASPEPVVLTVEEAAAILRLHPYTVAKMLREGKIRARKAGREWRITRAAMDEFLAGADNQPGQK